MPQLYLLAQDDQNEVQHDVFNQVIPLAAVLASHAAKGIVDGTIAFIRSGQPKWGVMWLLLVIWSY